MKEYYVQKQKELMIAYKGSSIAKHQGIVGTVRENLLVEILRAYFPPRVGIATGEIYSDLGRSGQIDLILYNAEQTNGLPITNQTKLIPAECVLAVIEIKSKLNKSKLIKGTSQLQSALKVVPPRIKVLEKHIRPFTVLIAYEFDRSSLTSTSKNLNTLISDQPGTPVNIVCVLDEGFVHFDHEFFPYNYVPMYNSINYGAFPSKEDTLHELLKILGSNLYR